MRILKHIIIISAIFSTALACVHTDMQRIGRLSLKNPKEGFAPIIKNIPSDYERVAIIKAQASAAGSKQRLTKYLQRQASVAGCDAISTIVHKSKNRAHALCLERRQPEHEKIGKDRLPVEASAQLLERLLKSNQEGIILAQLLEKSNSRSPAERRHLINWYLNTYPETAFRTELLSLFPSIEGIQIAAQAYTSSAL